jgi:hypothetical protein
MGDLCAWLFVSAMVRLAMNLTVIVGAAFKRVMARAQCRRGGCSNCALGWA